MTHESAFSRSMGLLEELSHRPILSARAIGLDRARILLRAVGDPQEAFHSVHVAGSSGKGSTTTMVGSILQSAGFRTGYFRSPHLVSYRERIAVDGHDIHPDEWMACFDRVWPVVKAMIDGSLAGYALGRPSLFEVLFAMGALHFRARGIEWAAVETGMGGRWDATNVLRSDVSVITTISLEHTQILGDSVAQIAAEKAAIIKPGRPAVTAAEGIALDVIDRVAATSGSSLTVVPRDVRALIMDQSVDGMSIRLETGSTSWPATLRVTGAFQATNAATAVAAVLALEQQGTTVRLEAVASGLEAAAVPGRLEVMGRNPLVLLDGAHHPAAARALADSMKALLSGRRVVLLFAALADKNIPDMVSALGPLAAGIIVTRAPGTSRAADPELIATEFRAVAQRVRVIADPSMALDIALSEAEAADALVVCGSLYLVGFVRGRLAEVTV